MITIIGCNKGGAAKTTTAINLAVGLAMRGEDVCLVDADVQRSASRWYAERENAGLTPAITLIEKRDNISQTLKSLDQKYSHVIVDVAGRNSRELITGGTVAHQIIAPHQCSQLDLDTLVELQQQLESMRDLNPELRAYCYQSMATTNPLLRGNERKEFLDFVAEFEGITPLQSVACYRKVYRDVMSEGKSVLEAPNDQARSEVLALIEEVF
ncbi:chromosome partitioning protein ParA [Chimaeribacter arupi]|uniref:Chromosome partitioning protein ParA n=2 Tax=Yersiniaceae TaxID=1903411 RepID=A0A2N5EKY3_9GAMM|nr:MULTISPECIES: AAA family ATPase [Yersiniaceae]MBS0970707.1 AAA family ATPase [Nissabacter archeti]MDV5142094.1 AAA family ATPase [Chimaeribacter arupi]PLR29449.1 chromosome partitioning protein ParA [Chimaeribacter arupi]PLR43160.1 chromosome partitioning protein ParA [Chimaeribacter arupi]PLR47393.1 chromosome partitioning protein ParA [Chimaeribacter arupi]